MLRIFGNLDIFILLFFHWTSVNQHTSPQATLFLPAFGAELGVGEAFKNHLVAFGIACCVIYRLSFARKSIFQLSDCFPWAPSMSPMGTDERTRQSTNSWSANPSDTCVIVHVSNMEGLPKSSTDYKLQILGKQ